MGRNLSDAPSCNPIPDDQYINNVSQGNEEEEGKEEKTLKEYTKDEKRQILYEYHDALTGGH